MTYADFIEGYSAVQERYGRDMAALCAMKAVYKDEGLRDGYCSLVVDPGERVGVDPIRHRIYFFGDGDHRAFGRRFYSRDFFANVLLFRRERAGEENAARVAQDATQVDESGASLEVLVSLDTDETLLARYLTREAPAWPEHRALYRDIFGSADEALADAESLPVIYVPRLLGIKNKTAPPRHASRRREQRLRLVR